MADNILFKSGLASKLNDITKIAGQLLFAIDGTSGSIYLDKDSTTRIKMNLDATKLQNARRINGIEFDGTQDITTSKWGTARTVIISDNDGTNTQSNANIDGSTNFTLKLPATIKATLIGKASTAGHADTAGSATTAASCTGNASSATKLLNKRLINGTEFDGSMDITTSSWGTARNFTIGNSTKPVNGSVAMSWSLSEIGAVSKAGDTMNGALHFANNTWNNIGDDVAIGDKNIAGQLCIKGLNGVTGIYFAPYSGSTGQSIIVDGNGNMNLNGQLHCINNSSESSLHANSAAGDIYLYSQGTSTANRGIYTISPSGKATTVLNVTPNNSVSFYGNASTASKLATARKITVSGTHTGSVDFDGSSDVELKIRANWCRSTTFNANNYPYHRFAKIDVVTGTYTDIETTFLVTGGYVNGTLGILKLILRTNDSGTVSYATAKWLILDNNLSEDQVKIGLYNVNGSTYADAFFKCSNPYQSLIFHVLESSERNTVIDGWTPISSAEVDNTTTSDKKNSAEVYTSIENAATILHNKAYTNIISATINGRADIAYALYDSNDNYRVTVTYGKIAQTSTNWLASWNGHEIGTISPANITAGKATKLATARKISLTGSVTGSGNFDGNGDLTITTATNHTHSYLPLAGGTMTGNAFITWPDTGNWSNGNSGVTFPVARGGLQWYGQSDYIKLYAEEAANDDLNLICQFGDDDSPSLIFRNQNGSQVSKISSDGSINLKSLYAQNLDGEAQVLVNSSTGSIYLYSQSGGNRGIYSRHPTMGGKHVIEIDSSNNVSLYGNAATATTATKLSNYYSSRPTSADLTPDGSGGIINFKATNSMTINKPGEGHILHMFWDNTLGWDSQFFIPSGNYAPQFRYQNSGTWQNWVSFLTANNYSSYALPLSGGTMTGALNFKNNTWNNVGDDVAIGDYNQAGHFCIRGLNGATGIYFAPYSGSTAQAITINGSGTMTITGTVSGTFSGSLSGNASTASKLGTSTIGSSVKPIYLNGGTATASSSTVGNSLTPVYLNGGTITQGETFGNRVYDYNNARVYYYNFGGGQDKNWKKVFAASDSSSHDYVGCTVKGTIYYFKGNHNQAEVEEYPFQMTMSFYAGASVTNSCTLLVAAGCPDTIIRAIRVTTNSFELQVRQPIDWRRIAIQFSFSGTASTMSAFSPVNATNTTVIPFSRLTTSIYISDSGNGTPITLNYSASGLSSASWFAAWNGYELRAISSGNTRSTIGAMAAINANGFYGMGTPSGGTSDWIRTTSNGIIPYQSGGASSLGTQSWPFNNAYINTVYGSLSGNASSATKLQTARNIFGRMFDGTGNITGRALFYGSYNSSVNSRFSTAALEIRENGLVDAAQTDIGYAPQIGFHWSNRVAGTLALGSDAKFRFIKQDGSTATLVATLEGYASSAGSSSWSSLLSSYYEDPIPYNRNSFQYFNVYGTAGASVGVNDTPTTQWWHILRCTYNNGNGYYTDVAIPFNDNQIYYKRINAGGLQNGGWVMVYDTKNMVYSSTAPSSPKVGTIWLKPA